MGTRDLCKIGSDSVTMGIVDVIINGPRGERRNRYENTLVQEFLNRKAQWDAGIPNTGQTSALPPTKFQLGTGSGTAQVSDTALFTPANSTIITVGARSASSNQATITINYAPNVLSGTYTEAGLLDQNNILLTHLMLSPSISIAADESVTFLYYLNENAG